MQWKFFDITFKVYFHVIINMEFPIIEQVGKIRLSYKCQVISHN